MEAVKMYDTKMFEPKLSERYDEPGRAIMLNWLSKHYENVKPRPSKDWKYPDIESDECYHEIQVATNWKVADELPDHIRIWGRKQKYVKLHQTNLMIGWKPVVFWALSDDGKAVACLGAEKLEKRPQTQFKSNKTYSGIEWVWDVPISEWEIYEVEV